MKTYNLSTFKHPGVVSFNLEISSVHTSNAHVSVYVGLSPMRSNAHVLNIMLLAILVCYTGGNGHV